MSYETLKGDKNFAQWAAGVFDLGGHVTLIERRGRIVTRIRVYVPLQWVGSMFKAVFGGSISRASHAYLARSWVWEISSHHDVMRFLTTLHPLCRIQNTPLRLAYLQAHGGIDYKYAQDALDDWYTKYFSGGEFESVDDAIGD